MPMGKGTYGSKRGRPPKKKDTKMAKGGMKKDKPSDFDAMVSAFKKKYGAKKAKELINQMLGGPTTDEQGVTRFMKGGMKKAKSYGKPGGYMGGGMAHGKKQAKKK
jgi:hypothetical protein